MAFVFTKALNPSTILFAYNNNIIRFYSDSGLTALSAEIVGFGFPVILYPSPDGTFYFNFKEYMTAAMNVDNFKDDFSVDMGEGEWWKDWTSKIYVENNFYINLILTEDTTETAYINALWLAAYAQVDEWKDTYFYHKMPDPGAMHALTPQVVSTSNTVNIKSWKGYPFDITILTPMSEDVTLILNNEMVSNWMFTSFLDYRKGVVNRICLSDGQFNLFWYYGAFSNKHNLMIFQSNEYELRYNHDVITPRCGEKHYLKWINRYGGWNYWLFEKGKKFINPKGLGEVNNDFNDFQQTMSQTLNIGVTSRKTFSMNADVTEEDMLTLSDLFESPKIYLFTGTPNTSSTYTDWIEVNMKDKQVKIADSKYNAINVQFDIELPTRVTRTL
jgi:hypothetical protein